MQSHHLPAVSAELGSRSAELSGKTCTEAEKTCTATPAVSNSSGTLPVLTLLLRIGSDPSAMPGPGKSPSLRGQTLGLRSRQALAVMRLLRSACPRLRCVSYLPKLSAFAVSSVHPDVPKGRSRRTDCRMISKSISAVSALTPSIQRVPRAPSQAPTAPALARRGEPAQARPRPSFRSLNQPCSQGVALDVSQQH